MPVGPGLTRYAEKIIWCPLAYTACGRYKAKGGKMKSLIPEILKIFKDTPKITKGCMLCGSYHCYQVLDELLIKHKLRELFKDEAAK